MNNMFHNPKNLYFVHKAAAYSISQRLFKLALPLAFIFGCETAPQTEVTDDENPCLSAENCIYENGEASCAPGFDWAAPNDANDYNCTTITRVLGGNSHSLEQVILTEIAKENGLNSPRDVAFNPIDDNQLWAVNNADNSVTVLLEPGSEFQVALQFNSFGSSHFLARPAALAFGDDGLMATAQEEDQETQGPVANGGTPADFMGPTLWPTNLNDFDGGHASHMDMLHNSPNSVGIAWETTNVYWIFDGAHNSITRYNFNADHDQGGAYHGDGIVARYAAGEVSYVPGVSSHMQLNYDTNQLFIADTGNNRIAVLDINSGSRGNIVTPNYDGSEQYQMNNATLTTLIDGSTIDGLNQPSGLELHEGLIYVSDYQSGMIFAFSLKGELLDSLDTGLGAGSIQGMAFSPEGDLFFANTGSNSIWRLQAR